MTVLILGMQTQEEAMKQKRGYEYEMVLARVDARNAAISISNISLTPSSAYVTKQGIGFCGLGICAIRPKQTPKA